MILTSLRIFPSIILYLHFRWQTGTVELWCDYANHDSGKGFEGDHYEGTLKTYYNSRTQPPAYEKSVHNAIAPAERDMRAADQPSHASPFPTCAALMLVFGNKYFESAMDIQFPELILSDSRALFVLSEHQIPPDNSLKLFLSEPWRISPHYTVLTC